MKRKDITCHRKVRYSDALGAILRFIQMAASGQDHVVLMTYRCDICAGFHLGNGRYRVSKEQRDDKQRGNANNVIPRFIVRLSASQTTEAKS